MLKPVWVVGFSGHRPKNVEGRSAKELDECRPSIQQALETYQDRAANLGGEIHCFSSVAEGADTIALEVSEEIGIVNHVILPMSVERFAEDFKDSAEAWDRTLAVIAKAGGLEELDASMIQRLCEAGSGRYSNPSDLPAKKKLWTFRISPGSRERPYCYYECGEEMLESCDGLLAVHSQSTEKIGGTTEVINQAEAKGLTVATVDPLTKTISWNSADDWKSDEVVEELKHISEKHSEEFPFSDDEDMLLESEFSRYNEVSLVNGRWFRWSLILSVLAHFAAATIGVTSLSYGWKGWWAIGATGVEGLLVLFAIGLVAFSWFYHFHERWRQTRFAAEVLRGLKFSCKFLDPLSPLISRHHPAWHRFAISNSLQQTTCIKQDPVGELAEYHRDRVSDQSSYFSSKLTPAWTWGNLWKYTATVSSIAAFVFLSAAFFSKCAHLGLKTDVGSKEVVQEQAPEAESEGAKSSDGDVWQTLFLKFLPTFLPLLASVAISLAVVTDYGRRKERYAIMVSRLKELASWFPTIRSPYAAKRAVERCEEILLDELVEWYASNKEITH